MDRILGVSLATLLLLLTAGPVDAAAYVVSGRVTAPGGIIAATDQRVSPLARLLDFLIAPAHAQLTGLLPVPNGTRAELVRINDLGRVTARIASTTTEYGRYRFNLTALKVSPSSRLVVRVGNVATGQQLRAFVTDKSVDINPVTEAAVRTALEAVATAANGTLTNFTVRELEDLAASLDLLTSAEQMATGADIESAVGTIRAAVAADTGIVWFVASSARAGQTAAGPGDIGDFFPLIQGSSLTYTVQDTEDGIASPPYMTTRTINGTQLIRRVLTTKIRDSNPDGDSVVENDYVRKTNAGLFDWEVVKDGESTKPHQFVRFPAAPGSSFKQSFSDMGFNADLDRDGTVERFTFSITTTVMALETISVPAGELANTLKVRNVLTGGTVVSSTDKRVNISMTAVDWYTQNLGMSKQSLSFRMTYDGRVWRDTSVLELTEANGFPAIAEFPLD